MTTLSAEEQVWNIELASWDYLKSGDLERYMSLFHEEVVAWPNNQPKPLNKDGLRALMAGILSMLQPGSGSSELTRVAVHKVDDHVIVHFEVHGQAVTRAGQEFPLNERFIHTWKNTTAGWKIIGGMGAPATNAATP